MTNRPRVHLLGAGVVGRAILQAHLDCGVPVCIGDRDPSRLQQALSDVVVDPDRWKTRRSDPVIGDLPTLVFETNDESADHEVANHEVANHEVANREVANREPAIVIESIAERLDAKQELIALVERTLPNQTIICSNTSTLRIGDVAAKMARPERFCGMHFFMPVAQRHAVEVVRGPATAPATIDLAARHAEAIHKATIIVEDGPGFIVNRLLSPYLNEAMLLLGRGITAERIEQAAAEFGMPISPLELIDWIGTRTMFDAGRAFWQAFPNRISPSPILAGLIKSKRLGRECGEGFYRYVDGERSRAPAPEAVELTNRYRSTEIAMTDREVSSVLALPMWIEAALALRDRVGHSVGQIELAMHGGLGYDANRSWCEFFETIGSRQIIELIHTWSKHSAALSAPQELLATLAHCTPTNTLESFARE